MFYPELFTGASVEVLRPHLGVSKKDGCCLVSESIEAVYFIKWSIFGIPYTNLFKIGLDRADTRLSSHIASSVSLISPFSNDG
jgi:hypothetical protein